MRDPLPIPTQGHYQSSTWIEGHGASNCHQCGHIAEAGPKRQWNTRGTNLVQIITELGDTEGLVAAESRAATGDTVPTEVAGLLELRGRQEGKEIDNGNGHLRNPLGCYQQVGEPRQTHWTNKIVCLIHRVQTDTTPWLWSA